MGSWNIHCAVSRMSLCEGARVKVFLIHEIGESELCRSGLALHHPPFDARYADHGKLGNITGAEPLETEFKMPVSEIIDVAMGNYDDVPDEVFDAMPVLPEGLFIVEYGVWEGLSNPDLYPWTNTKSREFAFEQSLRYLNIDVTATDMGFPLDQSGNPATERALADAILSAKEGRKQWD